AVLAQRNGTLMAYAVKQGIQDLVLDLINVGAPIPDYIDGIPPLAIVYGRGQMDLFQQLIVHGADTDIAIDGKTLLGRIIIDSEDWGLLFVTGIGAVEKIDGTLSMPF